MLAVDPQQKTESAGQLRFLAGEFRMVPKRMNWRVNMKKVRLK